MANAKQEPLKGRTRNQKVEFSLDDALTKLQDLNYGPISCYYKLLSRFAILISLDVLKPREKSVVSIKTSMKDILHDEGSSTQLPEFNFQSWMFMTWIYPYFHERQNEYMFGNCHHMLYEAYLEDEELQKAQRYSTKSNIKPSNIEAKQKVNDYMKLLRTSQEAAFEVIYGKEWKEIEDTFNALLKGHISLDMVDPLIHLMYLYNIAHVNYIQLVLLSEKELERDYISIYDEIMREASYLFFILVEKKKQWWTKKQESLLKYKAISTNSDHSKQTLDFFKMEMFIESQVLPAEADYMHWRAQLVLFLVEFSSFVSDFHSYTMNRVSKKGQTKESILNEVSMWLSRQQSSSASKRMQRIRRKRPKFTDKHIIPEELYFLESMNSENICKVWQILVNDTPNSNWLLSSDDQYSIDTKDSMLHLSNSLQNEIIPPVGQFQEPSKGNLYFQPEYEIVVRQYEGMDRVVERQANDSKL